MRCLFEARRLLEEMRYLDQSGEQHGDQKRRATDLIWSKNRLRLNRIVEEPCNPVLYCLQAEPDRAFICEEMMHIPDDTEVLLT